MAATVGLGIDAIAVNDDCSARPRSTMSVYARACISLMSAPAANTFSPPYTTTAETSRRSVASAAAAASPAWMVESSAFIGGRSILIVPIPPSTSSRTCCDIRSPLSPGPGCPGSLGVEPIRAPGAGQVGRTLDLLVPAADRRQDRLHAGADQHREVGPLGDHRVDGHDEHAVVHAELGQVVGGAHDAGGAQPVTSSCSAGAVMRHWPNTRISAGSASTQRTKSFCSAVRKATSPSSSRLGCQAVVDQDVEHPPAQGVLVGGRREAGNGRRVAHRSTVTVGHTAPVTAPSRPRTTRPYPLGVHLRADGDGADAAVFAAHAERVEVCLLDDDGAETPDRRCPWCTDGVWHGHVPGARAGQRYGLRVHGPWDPTRGPPAQPGQAAARPVRPRASPARSRWGQAVFGHVVDDQWRPQDGPAAHGGARWQDSTDSLGHVPTACCSRRPTRRAAPGPDVPWDRTVVYEAHVRGLTMRLPGVPEELRGTYAGLAHPAVVEHLRRPRRHRGRAAPGARDRRRAGLVQRGLTNYWGYNTLAFFAPHAALRHRGRALGRRGGGAREVIGPWYALHEAGLEVLLDVVYNHTCEGGADGPTLSFRGLDNASYYRHGRHGRRPRRHRLRQHPRLLATRGSWQMALDSLRYWVDGVRRRRLPVRPRAGPGPRRLARGADGFDPDHPFLVAARADPVLQGVKLVAEPWDVGTARLAHRPVPAAVRRVERPVPRRRPRRSGWPTRPARSAPRTATRARRARPGHPARRVGGPLRPRRPAGGRAGRSRRSTSSRRTTASPSPTSPPTTRKHNEANGEGNRDGTDDNRSWNHGVEGRTDDAGRAAAAARDPAALLSHAAALRPGRRCWWPATRSAAPSAATTTPTARTTRSPGSTGSSPPLAEDLRGHARTCCALRREHRPAAPGGTSSERPDRARATARPTSPGSAPTARRWTTTAGTTRCCGRCRCSCTATRSARLPAGAARRPAAAHDPRRRDAARRAAGARPGNRCGTAPPHAGRRPAPGAGRRRRDRSRCPGRTVRLYRTLSAAGTLRVRR